MKNIKRVLFSIICIFMITFLFACTAQTSAPEPNGSATDIVVPTVKSITFTPSPTIILTATPSKEISPTTEPTATIPTANFFTAVGATDEQALVMNTAISNLIQAGKNDDRETIADYLEYPLWVGDFEDRVWIENKQAFLSSYDSLLGKYFTQALSEVKFNRYYLNVSYMGVKLWFTNDYSNVRISFSNKLNGKINGIGYVGVDVPIRAQTSSTIQSTSTPFPTIEGTTSTNATSTPYWFPETDPNLNSIFTYFGTWVVSKVEFVDYGNCNVTVEDGQSEIGKKIELLPDQIRDKSGVFWSPEELYTHVLYSWEEEAGYRSKYTKTLPEDHPDRMVKPIFIHIAIDRSGGLIDLEVTKSARLVVNKYCFYYFLDKVPPSTSE